MNHWLYPANTKYYDVLGAFKHSTIYWPINSSVALNDMVYIYLAAPYKQLAFACEIKKINIEQASIIDKLKPYIKGSGNNSKKVKLFMQLKKINSFAINKDSSLTLQHLKEHGLNGMLMGPRKLENNPPLFNHIKLSTI